MPRFLIERKLPGAGELSAEQLRAISQKLNGVLDELRASGTMIQWDHSYVTGDTLHCVYLAPNVDAILDHARNGGFPCNAIMEVVTIISPTTGES